MCEEFGGLVLHEGDKLWKLVCWIFKPDWLDVRELVRAVMLACLAHLYSIRGIEQKTHQCEEMRSDAASLKASENSTHPAFSRTWGVCGK